MVVIYVQNAQRRIEMAAKGNVAKENVFKALSDSFGPDFIGEIDKKGYVWVDDGGTKVQICVSLTCPKTPIGEAPAYEEAGVGDDIEETVIDRLMKKLGFRETIE